MEIRSASHTQGTGNQLEIVFKLNASRLPVGCQFVERLL
jgi:hypothetical protein